MESLNLADMLLDSRRVWRLSTSELVAAISTYPTLQTAEILSTASYAKYSNFVKHRYLILKVRLMEDKMVFWMRLERRPLGRLELFVTGGHALASDTVSR